MSAPGLDGRLRSNSAVTNIEGAYVNGRKGESTGSLPLGGDRTGVVGKERKDKESSGFHATARAIGLVRGRSLNSALPNSRPGSSCGSTSGYGTGIGATSMVPTMNVAQMEEVIPWELHPVPPAPQRTLSNGGMTNDERDRKMVSITNSFLLFPCYLFSL